MNILHTISSIDKDSGGTSTYLQLLANELVNHISLKVNTIHSQNPLSMDERVKLFMAQNAPSLFNGFSGELVQHFANVDTQLFHGNGLWQSPVHSMVKAAMLRNIPYVLSPHGMLEPWALNAGKWKKKLAMLFFQRKDLQNANCIHATADSEARQIRSLGFTNPIAVIPNGIDVSEFPLKKSDSAKSKYKLLFLSRIHPKKGIEHLIEAWEQLDQSVKANWEINIAGNGDAQYIKSLQMLIDNKKFANEITIIGPQFGAKKLESYHQADLFVLPTYSENFGIVVAEALACGVPVITTIGAPWEELNTHQAGWWIDIGVKPLTQALNNAMQQSEVKRQQMGINGRKLVEENYSIESVAQKMIQLYQWILNAGEKPEFIY